MADLAITGIELPAKVAGTTIQLGEAVGAFKLVSLDAATSQFVLADATTVEKANAEFITLHGGSVGSWVVALPLISTLILTTTPVLVQGMQYVVSANSGNAAPVADLLTGQFKTKLFDGIDATTARFRVDATGIAIP